MLLGLIFRESAKKYRSFLSWRTDPRGILPSSTDKRAMFHDSTPVSNPFSHKEQYFTGPQATVFRHDTSVSETPSWSSTAKAGYGFGRQGEKAAGLRGFILQKPEESLPKYVAPPPSSKASVSRSASSVSTASSFYSKDVRRVEDAPPVPPLHRHDDQETESRSGTPTFKSSQRAI